MDAVDIPLSVITTYWVPGSYDDWSWDDETDDLLDGDMSWLLFDIGREGVKNPILLGSDGRVWDGHHRIVAARLFGLNAVPCEFGNVRD